MKDDTELAERQESSSRRRLLTLGGAAAGAAALAAIGPATASAACDDLSLLRDAPINVKIEAFWPSRLDADLGAALIAAIGYAETNGGHTVLAPAGVYEVDELSIPSGVKLTGEGPRTILECVSESSVAVRLEGIGASLIDLAIIDSNSEDEGSPSVGAVSVEAANCSVERVRITSSRQSGIALNEVAGRARIHHCRIYYPGSVGIMGCLNVGSDSTTSGVSIHGCDVYVTGEAGPCVSFRRDDSEGESSFTELSLTSNSLLMDTDTETPAIVLGRDDQVDSVLRSLISNNTTRGGSAGIVAYDSPFLSATGNTVTDFSGSGIKIEVNAESGTAGFATIVGNAITGLADDDGTEEDTEFSEFGIELISGGIAEGLVANGNSIRRCRTGIGAFGLGSLTVTGNTVEAVGDPAVYDVGGESEDSTGWAGITVGPAGEGIGAGDAVVTGNLIDGKEALPIGVKLHNARSVSCDGNLIRSCAGQDEDPPRDILIRVNDDALTGGHKETRGAVTGNHALVHVSSDSGGWVGDLRIAHNSQDHLPTVDSGTTMVVSGLPEIVSVGGNTDIESILNFNGRSPADPISYPGRRLALRFTDQLTVKSGMPGGNLKLKSNFITADGSTLVLASDGSKWYEVSRCA